MMLKTVRQRVVRHLWEKYREASSQLKLIEAELGHKSINHLVLDHFAVIDLPGPQTGIPTLSQLFSALGFMRQGSDYLADKQNDFLWMTEADSIDSLAHEVLPQVVVADFRLEEMPPHIKQIIEKYSHQAAAAPLLQVQKLASQTAKNDANAADELVDLVTNYLSGRDWPLPTLQEYETVHQFNELLAWVLIFGRRPNHFTLSIHHMNHFPNLQAFHQFIAEEVKLPLNQDGGVIKGSASVGIEQGSTVGFKETITLADGKVDLPTDFVEFVWRFSLKIGVGKPTFWNDFYTGFIAQHANRVIESLYVHNR